MRGTHQQVKKLMNALNNTFETHNELGSSAVFFENVKHARRDYGGLGKMILAKGISDRSGGKIIGIMPYDEQYQKMLEILGGTIDGDNFSFCDRIEIFLRMISIVFICTKIEDVVSLKCRGVCIGDLIYNTIIRSSKDIVTINKIKIFEHWKIIKQAISWTVTYDKKFRKVKPGYYIAEEPGYTQAAIARVAAKHGAKVIQYLIGSPCSYIESFAEGYYYDWNTIQRDNLIKLMEKESVVQEANGYTEHLFEKNDVFTMQVRSRQGKIVKEKKEVLLNLGITNTRKNVLIMLHCFSDNPCGKNNGIYKDYYEWYVETLKIIQRLNNVNWIIRPHPARNDYYEKNMVENVLKEYKSKNIYLLPDEYGPEIIPKLADAIITVSGTAGVEYSALGIPCVVTGTPFYACFGYTINVGTIKMYEKVLKNMHRVHKLAPDQIRMAERVFYLYKEECIKYKEEGFEGLFYHALGKVYQGWKDIEINREFISELCEWIEQNDIKESYLYKFGFETV